MERQIPYEKFLQWFNRIWFSVFAPTVPCKAHCENLLQQWLKTTKRSEADIKHALWVWVLSGIYDFCEVQCFSQLTAKRFSALKIIQPQAAFRGDASPRAIHPFVPPRKGCDVTKILYSRDLHGSLAKEFSELRALEKLNLRDNNITGNLEVLKENTALTYLNLQNTRISGDLQSLAKVTKLEHLYLQGTQVSGDLVALSNAKDLEVLGLSETKVYGDLVALSNATDLSYLYLSETKVHGDLASFANLTELLTLKLSNTKVSGDFSVISQWKKMYRLGLSGTEVTSHPIEKWQKCCEHLKTLDLARTKIRIVDGFLANFESYNYSGRDFNCPFPSLTSLEMTGTPLNITVEELLRTFIGCKELRIFKAADCSLTGPMPEKFTGGGVPTPDIILRIMAMSNWPLSQVLQLLDLSSNNVTKVEALPHNCRAVSFGDNPQISFEEDVLKKATEHFVSLDLRNATFAHTSDARSSKNLSIVFKVGASRPIVCGKSVWPLVCSRNACINCVTCFSL